MVKRKEKKVDAVLRGDLVRTRTPGTWLVNLFRIICKGLRINDAEWNSGIHDLVNTMVRNGELDEGRKPHKPGNLSNALCEDEMTWRTFISGIRMIVSVRIHEIARVKLTLTFERRSKDTIVESEFSTTLHENSELLDLSKKPKG